MAPSLSPSGLQVGSHVVCNFQPLLTASLNKIKGLTFQNPLLISVKKMQVECTILFSHLKKSYSIQMSGLFSNNFYFVSYSILYSCCHEFSRPDTKTSNWTIMGTRQNRIERRFSKVSCKVGCLLMTRNGFGRWRDAREYGTVASGPGECYRVKDILKLESSC